MSYSVASMLMRRKVWEQLGGFSEGLRTGEDIIFVRRINEGSFSVGLAPKAAVHWQIPRSLGRTIHRLVNYSHYGLEAGLGHTWHYRTFLYCALALLLVVLGLIHSTWWFAMLGGLFAVRVIKTVLCNEKKKRGLQAFTVPRFSMVGCILLAADMATLYGTFRWLMQSRGRHLPGQPVS